MRRAEQMRPTQSTSTTALELAAAPNHSGRKWRSYGLESIMLSASATASRYRFRKNSGTNVTVAGTYAIKNSTPTNGTRKGRISR